jgi:hypothetical protein
MLSQEEIKKKLNEAGFEEQELDTVISEVNDAILKKIIAVYFSSLADEEQARLKDLTSDELAEFVGKNKDKWPKFSQLEFEKMYEDNWADYFKAISSKN